MGLPISDIGLFGVLLLCCDVVSVLCVLSCALILVRKHLHRKLAVASILRYYAIHTRTNTIRTHAYSTQFDSVTGIFVQTQFALCPG
jgi:hypothetical protein